MPTAPYAKLRANIAGAGNLSGALVGAASATCQLSQDPAGLGSSFLYEITDYPEGFPVPAGWTASSLSGVYSYVGLTPPSFTLPASPLWGKLVFRLTVNNGDPGTSGLPKTQLTDSSTVVSTPDPSGNGYEDIAYGESNQWDAKRKWMGPLKRNIRKQAKQSIPSYAGVPDGYILSLVSGVPTWVAGVSSFSGDLGAVFASYGLTVNAFFRPDIGLSGTTGTGKSGWANQMGATTDMVIGTSGATNGLGTPSTPFAGRTGLIINGTDQFGKYTLPSSITPGTTNFHIYSLFRILSVPTIGYLHAGPSANVDIYAGQTPPAANFNIFNGSYGAPTTGVVTNQWYRMRVSWIGGLDVVRVGAHEPTPTTTSNSPMNTAWTWGGVTSAACNVESLGFLHITGPMATFLTAAADADAKARAYWSTSIEI